MKRIVLLSMFLFLSVGSAYSQEEYSRFIHRKPQGKESYFQQFLKFFAQQPFNGSYAMIIAIGKYEHLPRLDSPIQDAAKMKTFLLQTGDYDEVVVLQDEDARFETIRYFMQTYFPGKMMQQSGRYRFLFYFTGHGTQQTGYDENIIGYLELAAATGSLNDSEAIDMTQLENWANQFRYAKHILFLLDCCFSGSAGKEIKGEYNTTVDPGQLAKENGRFMITAGGANELSIGDLKTWGGSLFTDAMIKGMQGEADTNADGVVTTLELFSYTQAAVRDASGGKQTPHINQLGKWYADKGEYFFVYRIPDVSTPTSGAKPPSQESKGSETPAPSPPAQGSEITEPLKIKTVTLTDVRGRVIPLLNGLYTIQTGQQITITVEIEGAQNRQMGVTWSANKGSIQATDRPVATYTAPEPGSDKLIIAIWDKTTGEKSVSRSILLYIVP